jgi:hypothetical protein
VSEGGLNPTFDFRIDLFFKFPPSSMTETFGTSVETFSQASRIADETQ